MKVFLHMAAVVLTILLLVFRRGVAGPVPCNKSEEPLHCRPTDSDKPFLLKSLTSSVSSEPLTPKYKLDPEYDTDYEPMIKNMHS